MILAVTARTAIVAFGGSVGAKIGAFYLAAILFTQDLFAIMYGFINDRTC
jgi:hypothetical protein